MADTERLRLLRALNPKFAEDEAKGEKWALQQAECVRGIDGEASRRYPERARREDGKPQNWCGSCPFEEGCIMCDLDENHAVRKAIGSRFLKS